MTQHDDINAIDRGRLQQKKQSDRHRSKQYDNTKAPQLSTCTRYGRHHEPKRCSTYKQKCHKCNGTGHFAKVCRSDAKSKASDMHDVNQVNSADDSTNDDTVLALTESRSRRVYSHLEVESKTVRFLLDCGSTVNLLPRDLVNTLHLPIKEDNCKLCMLDG